MPAFYIMVVLLAAGLFLVAIWEIVKFFTKDPDPYGPDYDSNIVTTVTKPGELPDDQKVEELFYDDPPLKPGEEPGEVGLVEKK